MKIESMSNVQDTINGRASTISIGMTKEEVRSAWGESDKSLKYGENIWVYSTDTNKSEYEKLKQKTAVLFWVFFENGKVSKIERNDLSEYKFQCSTVDL